MSLWHLGNTTVRSPFRLREGLIALKQSGLPAIRGREGDEAFRTLLGERGIVELGTDATFSVGRKWRSALTKLGFLVPSLPPSLTHLRDELGDPDTISENGHRLIDATTVPGMQECFLRALAAHYIPDPLKDHSETTFSPLRYVLAVMQQLERATGASRLSFLEFALEVQTNAGTVGPVEVVKRIQELRGQRERAANKRRFDDDRYRQVAAEQDYVPGTFRDYADTNFRYLKATGLVLSQGRGISLREERSSLIGLLAEERPAAPKPEEYVRNLCRGAPLPTDDAEKAKQVLMSLIEQVKARGLAFDLRGRALESAGTINTVRHEVEQLLDENNERSFAAAQPGQWDTIRGFLELFIDKEHKKTLADGTLIEFPKSEGPAYLEWIIWRAFLAINHLRNEASSARRFKVDQDFVPIGTAPGGGPDMIFEFDDFVLVVEVTLTESSRQEAAEGETVRRHVADIAARESKPVLGLFVAHRIDTNTAETFRIGSWYSSDDNRQVLNIVPLTLAQFRDVVDTLFKGRMAHPNQVRAIIEQCASNRAAHDAPAWKATIAQSVRDFAARYG